MKIKSSYFVYDWRQKKELINVIKLYQKYIKDSKKHKFYVNWVFMSYCVHIRHTHTHTYIYIYRFLYINILIKNLYYYLINMKEIEM
jgi:hypothetical protein